MNTSEIVPADAKGFWPIKIKKRETLGGHLICKWNMLLVFFCAIILILQSCCFQVVATQLLYLPCDLLTYILDSAACTSQGMQKNECKFYLDRKIDWDQQAPNTLPNQSIKISISWKILAPVKKCIKQIVKDMHKRGSGIWLLSLKDWVPICFKHIWVNSFEKLLRA